MTAAGRRRGLFGAASMLYCDPVCGPSRALSEGGERDLRPTCKP